MKLLDVIEEKSERLRYIHHELETLDSFLEKLNNSSTFSITRDDRSYPNISLTSKQCKTFFASIKRTFLKEKRELEKYLAPYMSEMVEDE